MKLFRFGDAGAEKPAILDKNGIGRDLSSVVDDIAGDVLTIDGLQKLAAIDPAQLPKVPESARIGPCIGNSGRFFCIGLNYSDHAAEAGMDVPNNPIVFMKVCPPTGPNDPLMLPKGSVKTDWEVELGVIIGKRAQHVSVENALEHVAGYCVINDVSEREFQIEHGGQWVKGKSCDGFGPIGPWLVTRDEIPDPQNVDLWLDLNGRRMQTGNSKRMVFSVAEIIEHLSRFMTLEVGDIISTGTPPGVGMGQKPPLFLEVGDMLWLGIEGLGTQHQEVLAYQS